MKKKIFLITHPVDYGNFIVEGNLIKLFENRTDLQHFSFSDMKSERSGSPYMKKLSPLLSRLSHRRKLKKIIKEKGSEVNNRTIVYQGISPALFSSMIFKKANKKVIILDWTRKLYEPLRNKKMSPFWLTFIHKKVLQSCDKILCVTESAKDTVINGYGIDSSKVHKIILPFDTSPFEVQKNHDFSEIKLFFVGGDFIRKGGDLLINWYKKLTKKNVKLTIVTQNEYDWPEGIITIKNDPKKGIKHEFPKHDIFVMPTRWDSYPQVLIEAAASGLAVITTRFALGAPDIVENNYNGFICRDFEEFFEKLEYLIERPELIKKFKENGPAKAGEVYNPTRVFNIIDEFI